MSNQDTTPRLYLITGSRGAGKTSLCRTLLQAARAASWQTTGLLSNPIFDGVYRVQIVAEDVSTGQTRLLATRKKPEDIAPAGLDTNHWLFDPAALTWGNTVLAAATPTDLLLVDELGPLEFEREQGWLAGLDALDSRDYTIGIVVVRAELLGQALLRWPDAYIVEVDTPEDSQDKAKALSRLFTR